MILPLLMAGSALPPLGCPPDDVVAWLCFLLGMGFAALIGLIARHVCR